MAKPYCPEPVQSFLRTRYRHVGRASIVRYMKLPLGESNAEFEKKNRALVKANMAEVKRHEKRTRVMRKLLKEFAKQRLTTDRYV
jgi:hypothetical protein